MGVPVLRKKTLGNPSKKDYWQFFQVFEIFKYFYNEHVLTIKRIKIMHRNWIGLTFNLSNDKLIIKGERKID